MSLYNDNDFLTKLMKYNTNRFKDIYMIKNQKAIELELLIDNFRYNHFLDLRSNEANELIDKNNIAKYFCSLFKKFKLNEDIINKCLIYKVYDWNSINYYQRSIASLLIANRLGFKNETEWDKINTKKRKIYKIKCEYDLLEHMQLLEIIYQEYDILNEFQREIINDYIAKSIYININCLETISSRFKIEYFEALLKLESKVYSDNKLINKKLQYAYKLLNREKISMQIKGIWNPIEGGYFNDK